VLHVTGVQDEGQAVVVDGAGGAGAVAAPEAKARRPGGPSVDPHLDMELPPDPVDVLAAVPAADPSLAVEGLAAALADGPEEVLAGLVLPVTTGGEAMTPWTGGLRWNARRAE